METRQTLLWPFLSENYNLKNELEGLENDLKFLGRDYSEFYDETLFLDITSTSPSPESNKGLELKALLDAIDNRLKSKINSFNLIKSNASIPSININIKPQSSYVIAQKSNSIKNSNTNDTTTQFKHRFYTKDHTKPINIESNQRKIDLIKRIRKNFAEELNIKSNKKQSIHNLQKPLHHAQPQQLAEKCTVIELPGSMGRTINHHLHQPQQELINRIKEEFSEIFIPQKNISMHKSRVSYY
jgi:hypothetical protein